MLTHGRSTLLSAIASASLSALACAPVALAEDSETAHTSMEQTYLDNVTAFYNAALNDKDAEAARGYLGDVYIQHNPRAADGPEGLVGFVGWLGENFPDNSSEIKRSFVDGDHVVLHVHTKRTPDSLGMAVMEIFRVDEDGLIVEHWDVQQEVPEESMNSNTMF